MWASILFVMLLIDFCLQKCYVLYMKKLFIFIFVLMFVLPIFNVGEVFADNSSSYSYIVVGNLANIYLQPDFASEKLTTVKNKTLLVLEVENGQAKEYKTGDYTFFKVLQYQSLDGFILADLVAKNSNQIVAVPSFNGQTNSDAVVYFLQDLNMVESDIVLKKNHKIFLYQKYQSKSDFTAIAFLFENEVVYGYIKTEFVEPNGVNPLLISAIFVIIAVISIIFAWLFMQNKKSKKTKKIKIKKIENQG